MKRNECSGKTLELNYKSVAGILTAVDSIEGMASKTGCGTQDNEIIMISRSLRNQMMLAGLYAKFPVDIELPKLSSLREKIIGVFREFPERGFALILKPTPPGSLEPFEETNIIAITRNPSIPFDNA